MNKSNKSQNVLIELINSRGPETNKALVGCRSVWSAFWKVTLHSSRYYQYVCQIAVKCKTTVTMRQHIFNGTLFVFEARGVNCSVRWFGSTIEIFRLIIIVSNYHRIHVENMKDWGNWNDSLDAYALTDTFGHWLHNVLSSFSMVCSIWDKRVYISHTKTTTWGRQWIWKKVIFVYVGRFCTHWKSNIKSLL